MQKRPHQQNGGALRAPPFLPAFFCILFFTILGYFRKYFEKKMKMSVLTSFGSGNGAAGPFFSIFTSVAAPRFLDFFSAKVAEKKSKKRGAATTVWAI